MAVVVACKKCGKRLSIPESLYDKKVRGRVVIINCKACGEPVKVDGTIPPPAVTAKLEAPASERIPRSARVPREAVPSSKRYFKPVEELPSIADHDWSDPDRDANEVTDPASTSAPEAVRVSYADGAITLRQPLAKIGRYALFEQFASGGMATVHFGRLDGAGGFSRVVAVKRLLPHLVLDREFTEMLLKEARLAARVRHPNVVQTLDVVASKGDVLLVLEYIHGDSLSTLCRIQAKEQKNFIPIPIVAAIMHGVLQGLHAVHEAVDEKGRLLGLIHRDISPPNVLVGVDGMARVLDFGIAKALEHLEESVPNRLKGKTGYMSPEQVRGERLTRRSDVFAAGIILWEMLTLRRLFSAKVETDRIDRIMRGGYQRPREYRAEISPELEAVVMRALAFDPNERFANIREFEEALEKATPSASARVVAEWVQGLAHESLAARALMVAQVENWDSGHRDAELTSTPFASETSLSGFPGPITSTSRSTAPPAPMVSSLPPPQPLQTVEIDVPPPKRRGGLLVALLVLVVLAVVYVVGR